VEAGCQPCPQTGLGVREIHARYADLGKSKLTRPLAQLLQEPLPVRPMSITHQAILETHVVDWPDEAACEAFATRLARASALRDAFVELHGPLGAGKTTFARHLLRALGVQGRIKSPTYAVLEPYQLGELEVSHFDFYRFDDPREWADAGFRDIFGRPGLKLAEWPEKAEGMLPTADLQLWIEPDDDDEGARRVTLHARTATGCALLGAVCH
jgi:tRNA threonylcarbamoyladenosine biosynthesis protein TsaE